jgi:SAM-dependent methyltransferase
MPGFLQAISSTAFQRRVQELCAKDPSVQVLSWMLGPEGTLQWAHSVAVVTDPVLGKLVPPLPPLDLRRITAAPEEQIFLWTGLIDIKTFFSLFDQYGRYPNGAKLKVLDFGCGCGRLTRYLDSHDGVVAFGSDVNPDLVEWCSQSLRNTHTSLNQLCPPLNYPDKTFDFIFSLSVFTHLAEAPAEQWLRELTRILAPGGALIVTTHGYPALSIIRNSPVHHQMFQLDEERTAGIINELPHKKYIHLRYPPDSLSAAKAGDEYGNTFIDPSYIYEHWNSAGLRVLAHIPGGLRGWQDTVVLSRSQ